MKIIKKDKAFTLLELIIVIIIIGVLASLALPRLFAVVEGARAAEAISAMATIRSAMDRCYLQNNASFGDCNLGALDIDDPGDSPGAHFFYDIYTYADWGYIVLAVRNTLDSPSSMDPVRSPLIAMGYNFEPKDITDGQLWYLAAFGIIVAGFPNVTCWKSSSVYRGYIPKNVEACRSH